MRTSKPNTSSRSRQFRRRSAAQFTLTH